MNVQGKHILVVGLARSGLAVANALAHRGAVVTVTDRKQPAEFRDVLPGLLKQKMGLELGIQRVETFLKNEVIVVSPGVPWDLPQLQAAREKAIPVYPEVEAASWFLEGTLVGVTGSNGKTTTTSLLGDMLKASGFPTFVGGNIGNALSAAVDQAAPGTRYVTELSSFQLEGIAEFRPHVAVMLNLSPNHLDRHPSLEAYAAAKQRIFHNQKDQDYAVLNADDPWVAGLQASVPSRAVMFSRRRELPSGVFAADGKVYYRVRHLERVLFETRDVTLRGDFNLEDVLAATTAACLLGADFGAIRKAVRNFQAVEHRLEFVREIRGVEFYNNSKATSVDATLKSLEAFERNVLLIMGGKDKGAPYTPLVPLIKERVRSVLVIGAAAPIITEQLAGAAEIVQAGDLAVAVAEAFNLSRPGDTVLLAPACSSFDQFNDYEQRGRVFKRLVNELAKEVAEGRRPARPSAPPAKVAAPPAREMEPAIGDVGSATRDLRKPPQTPAAPPPVVARPQPDFVIAPPPAETAKTARPEPEFIIAPPAADPEKTAKPRPEFVIAPRADVPKRPEPPPEPPKRPEPPPSSALVKGTAAPPAADAPALPSPRPESARAHAGAELHAEISDFVVPGPQPPTPPREAAAPAPEVQLAAPVPKIQPATPPTPGPKPGVPPRHVELEYVYEVDAVEVAPAAEFASQDEDDTPLPAGVAEVLDDEVLPFETRAAAKGGAAARRRKPGSESSKPSANAKSQPGLFGGGKQ